MLVIPISNKTFLARHWFRWYRVQRGGEDWRPLKAKPYAKPKSIAEISKSLSKKYPTGQRPDILDEAAADREVAKRLKNKKKYFISDKKKGQPKLP